MKNTPTPWEVFAWKSEDGAKAAEHHIRSVSGQLIARAYKRNLSLVESESNADFIVRAVNSHDELLDAVYEANKYFAYCRENLKGERSEQEVIDQCDVAQMACLNVLAKVESKS